MNIMSNTNRVLHHRGANVLMTLSMWESVQAFDFDGMNLICSELVGNG